MLVRIVFAAVAAFPIVFMLVSSFARGRGSAGAIALQNTSASFAGFVGPAVFGVLREQTGDFTSGMLMLAIGLLISAAIVLALGRAISTAKVRVAS